MASIVGAVVERQFARLLADPVRRVVGSLAVLAGTGLTLVSVRYAGMAGPGRVDTEVAAGVQSRFESYRSVLRIVVNLSEPVAGVLISAALVVGCLALRRRRLAVLAIVGPLLTGMATIVLKPVVGRTLDGSFSLPSGHTAGATAVATVIAMFVISTAGSRALPVALLCSAGVLGTGVIMAVALVVNDLHYVTDTVAGFCAAIAVVPGTAIAIDAIADRRADA